METLIIGAGGHGRVVLDILRAAGQYTPVGFIDSDPTLAGTQVMDLDVLGDINLLPKLRKQNISRAIVAIGDNRNRLTQAQFKYRHSLEHRYRREAGAGCPPIDKSRRQAAARLCARSIPIDQGSTRPLLVRNNHRSMHLAEPRLRLSTRYRRDRCPSRRRLRNRPPETELIREERGNVADGWTH